MDTELQIIAGGGWVTRHFVARAKARFFAFLSVVWLPVVGVFLSWFSPDGAAFAGTWLGSLAVLLEVIFIALAVLFWMTEEPRAVTERHHNLNSDPRKLH